jgi:hypothetical protein
MRQRTKLAFAMLLSSCCLISGNYSCLGAQVDSVQASREDTKAIEAIVHSNPSDHVTEDVSFTNIFGTVRYGRAEFVKRHIEIANTIFKGTTPKSSIAKLRFVRQDVAIADVSGEITGFPKNSPPQGCPLERTECCVSSCSSFLSKNKASGGSWNTTTSQSHLKRKRHFLPLKSHRVESYTVLPAMSVFGKLPGQNQVAGSNLLTNRFL